MVSWTAGQASRPRASTACREDHTDHLLALLNLEIWAQIYLDGRAAADLAGELSAEVAAAE